jgi:hypothetical protein
MSKTLRLPIPAAPSSGERLRAPVDAELPGFSDDLDGQISALAASSDMRASLLVGQAAIARFGPVPMLLRYTLQAARQLLEDAQVASDAPPGDEPPPSYEGLPRRVAAYLDALLDTAVPVAGAYAPLFVQVVLALFTRRRWHRAASLLEAAVAAGRPAVPEVWVRASLARAYANCGQHEQARAALAAATRAP